jgi:FkbM family methyltransferase
MKLAIKRAVGPVLRPFIHCWQWFYDRARAEWRNFRDSRKALRRATMIVQDIHGIRFVLYSWDRSRLPDLLHRRYDVAEFQAIPRLVRPGDVAFDVGANLGLYSVLLSRLCGSAGRVWAFEPVPDTYWRLRETLALNRCENVTPVQAAVCERVGSVRMNLFESEFAEWNTLGMPSMRTPDGFVISPHESVDVVSRTLDEFCETEKITRINFLKVDVEGFEVSVFQGAESLLREHRVDYVCFEISKDPLKGAGVESRKVFEALEMRGYAAYGFDKATGRFFGPVSDTAESWTNFFASWMDMSKFEEKEHAPRNSGLSQESSIVGNLG